MAPPAFSRPNPNYDGNWDKNPIIEGMKLRSFYKAHAVALMGTELVTQAFGRGTHIDWHDYGLVAECAAKIADALLAEDVEFNKRTA